MIKHLCASLLFAHATLVCAHAEDAMKQTKSSKDDPMYAVKLTKEDIDELGAHCQKYAIELRNIDSASLIQKIKDEVKHPDNLKEIYESICKNLCVEAELAMRGTNALQALSNGLTNKTIVATGLSTPCAEVGNICKFRIENVTQPTVLYLSVYNDDICDAIIRKMRVTPKGQP